MAVTHTEADATAATAMTNAVADIEQETPEIEKERQAEEKILSEEPNMKDYING